MTIYLVVLDLTPAHFKVPETKQPDPYSDTRQWTKDPKKEEFWQEPNSIHKKADKNIYNKQVQVGSACVK